MKFQRFIGSTGREALAQVREALGPQAMILSNRSVAEGIEILACDETDFSSAIGDQALSAAMSADRDAAPLPDASGRDGLQDLMTEIRTMRDSLETRLAELTEAAQQQRDPAKSDALKAVLRGHGFRCEL